MRGEEREQNSTHARRPVSVEVNGIVWEVKLQMEGFEEGNGAS